MSTQYRLSVIATNYYRQLHNMAVVKLLCLRSMSTTTASL